MAWPLETEAACVSKVLVLYNITWCQYPEEHGLPFVNESSGPVIVFYKYGTEIFGSVICGNYLSSRVATSFSKILHHGVS
jgi:hypothetical protein